MVYTLGKGNFCDDPSRITKDVLPLSGAWGNCTRERVQRKIHVTTHASARDFPRIRSEVLFILFNLTYLN